MPWCKKCKEEYIKRISHCPKCGGKLTANNKITTAPDKPTPNAIDNDMELKLLFTIETDVQFALITDALKQENIQFSTETEKLWDHMQILYNRSNVGQKVLVSEKDYDKAKDILDYFDELKDSLSE